MNLNFYIEETGAEDEPGAHHGGHNQGFLQYWDKELEANPEIKDEIIPMGPIGEALEDYKIDPSEPYEQYESEGECYQQEEDQFDSLLDYSEKNFADVIDNCQARRQASCHNEQLDHQPILSPERPLCKEEVACPSSRNSSPERTRKREVKFARKLVKRSHRRHLQKECENTPSNEPKQGGNNSELIIKIRSGNNVLKNEIVEVSSKQQLRKPLQSKPKVEVAAKERND